MASIALIALPLAMTTTRFTREICCEASAQWQLEQQMDFQSLHMNWVVVVDKKRPPPSLHELGGKSRLETVCNVPLTNPA